MRRVIVIVLIVLIIISLVVFGVMFFWTSLPKLQSNISNQVLTNLGPAEIAPNTPFYSMKKYREKLAIKTTKNREAVATLNLNLANERIREVNSLVNLGRSNSVAPLLVSYYQNINLATVNSSESAKIRQDMPKYIMAHVSDLIRYYPSVRDLDAKVAFVNTIDRESTRVQMLINKLDSPYRLETQRAVLANLIEADKFLRVRISDRTLPTINTNSLKLRYFIKDAQVAQVLKKYNLDTDQ